MLNPSVISKMIVKNINKYGNPIGLGSREINNWWKGLDIKCGKGRILFTGMMYQLTPYITKITERFYNFENTAFESFIPMLNTLPTFSTNLAVKLFVKPERGDLGRFSAILKKIYLLLSKSGIKFYYNPKLDFYSGILLYDLGLDHYFEEYARKVTKELERNGVTEIITVDPHTTYALKELYPKYAEADFKVKIYLELIRGEASGSLTLHDPCYYARYLDFYDQPRELLGSAGAEYVDVRNSKGMTYCCGAPIEGLTPKLSCEIAKIRFSELSETGCKIVTMCPLCLARLKCYGDVYDIAEILGDVR